MGLREQFTAALKEAMKASDRKRTGTLRLVLAALKERDIAGRTAESREGISDDEILTLLAKLVKQREDSIALYEQGGRPELAAAEAEAKAAIAAVITELGAASMKDMGKVMAALKERFAGKMDFSKTSAAVKELLSTPK